MQLKECINYYMKQKISVRNSGFLNKYAINKLEKITPDALVITVETNKAYKLFINF